MRIIDAAEKDVAHKVYTRVCMAGAGPDAAVRRARALMHVSRWIRWVLVDNMLTAEIGKKCLPLGGWSRFGGIEARRGSDGRRPTTVTGG